MEEKSNQNIVNFGFVLAGFLTYFISNVVMEVLAGTFGAVARFRNIEAVKHGLPVSLGLIVFFVLFLNPKVQTWADEVVSEVRKVVWPTRQETVGMTVVCCVMVLLAGLGLGVYDFVSSQLIKFFVN